MPSANDASVVEKEFLSMRALMRKNSSSSLSRRRFMLGLRWAYTCAERRRDGVSGIRGKWFLYRGISCSGYAQIQLYGYLQLESISLRLLN